MTHNKEYTIIPEFRSLSLAGTPESSLFFNHRAQNKSNFLRPNMGVSENWGTFFWGPCNKDPTI